MSATYGLVSYAAPASALEGLAELVSGFQRWQSLTAGAALALVLAALVAAAVLKAPAPGRVAFAGAVIFSALLLFISVRSKFSTSFQEAVSARAPAPERFKFDAPVTRAGLGPAVDEPFDAEATAQLTSQLRANRDLHDAAGDPVDEASLTLLPGVKAEGLERALRAVAQERYRAVTLLTGPTQPAPSTLPPPFDTVRSGSQGLKLGLAFKEDACPVECELATLKADTLGAGDETWPLERAATTQDDGAPLYLAAAPLEPAALLAAVATAAKHRRSLTLVFEGHAPAPPEDTWADPRGPAPRPPPVAKADLLNITAAGAHTLAQVKNALGASTEPLQQCALEGETLPATVHVELAVNAAGEVATLVTEDRDELGWCVRDVLERVDFPELDKAALSLVRLDVRFTPLEKKK